MLSASHEVGWWNGVVVRKEGWVKKAFIVHILALSDFAARDVFCCPQVAELPACVLSVAGAMRTGKSFLLDQMVSIFLALVLMEWSEISILGSQPCTEQWSRVLLERRDVAAHQWNPHLRSGLHCFLVVFQPAFQFLLLHFTPLCIYISQPSPATHCGAQR